MDFDDVVSAAEGVRTGQVSARELVQRSLDRIVERDEPLNAFVHVDGAGALAAADRVDAARRAGEELGPLAGVPFGVKDLEDCAGMPTTRGSRWYADAGPANYRYLALPGSCHVVTQSLGLFQQFTATGDGGLRPVLPAVKPNPDLSAGGVNVLDLLQDVATGVGPFTRPGAAGSWTPLLTCPLP
jgi:hypothetical protein